jgi:malate dehydrogenase (quinone)
MSNFFDPRYPTTARPDVVLVGAGIMSATLGFLLKELDPTLTIEIYERLDVVAGESSDAWNNAGTGHAGFCELNYTPQNEDGSVDVKKAFKIAEQFEVSKQFWAYLLKKNYIQDPQTFINQVPHLSAVFNPEDIDFLKKRYELLSQNALFDGMIYSEDATTLKEWIPLMFEGREDNQPIAATKIDTGTDVDFGALTRAIMSHLVKQEGVQLFLNHEVKDIDKVEEEEGIWQLKIKNRTTKERRYIDTPFVFIGAGGGALPLLQKTDIDESDGFGGFPVSGQWLICKNQKLIEQHHAKVYGKAEVGSPPMSVPHLDTRIINGKKALLFGPYAGFSTKFLKKGSWFDLVGSIEFDNVIPMVAAGLRNIPLTKYLVGQVTQSQEDRLVALKRFIPNADIDDWELEEAGQRVQIIKKNKEKIGVLEFGTEIVHSQNGTVAALLGASPGASTGASIMLELLQKCFKDKMETPEWQAKLAEIIPSYGKSLYENQDLCRELRAMNHPYLEMEMQGQKQTL